MALAMLVLRIPRQAESKSCQSMETSPRLECRRARLTPYARPTFYYTNGEPTGLGEGVLSTLPPGRLEQKIVLQVGFVPIK